MKLMTFHRQSSRPLRFLLPLGLLLLSGCVYRIPIQQGNFLEAKDLDQINVGMTRSQVRYLLGTPMVADSFNDARWDYIYYLKRGRIGEPTRRQFIVFFDGDKVEKMERSGQFPTAEEKKAS
ncbi:MAG: outer membrane protein assembly factor BamE [Steroidobacteraceae bacterium]